MANPLALPAADRLLIHGIVDTEAADVIGPGPADFAGTEVFAIKGGSVSAVVSRVAPAIRAPRWLRRTPKAPRLAPAVSALASLMPMLPVAPGTVFTSEESLCQLLHSRESELAALIAEHSALLECDLYAGFDLEVAEGDLATRSPLAALRGDTESEQALIERSLKQSIVGRQATFLARLNRRLIDIAVDMLPLESQSQSGGLRRKILIAREERERFRASLISLAEEVGLGAWLRIGPYLPPVSFRRLEISSADAARVNEARAALGVGESADRGAIRIAYHRTIERCYPHVADDQRQQRLTQLEQLFGLLNLVADGQIKAASGETLIRFDQQALRHTWLLRLHRHDLVDRAA